MVGKGQVATLAEVKARWAYSELTSDRFGAHYLGRGPQRLHCLAAKREPFSNVQVEDWPELGVMLLAARPMLAGLLAGAVSYLCEGWDRRRLQSSLVLPLFNPANDGCCISYDDFYRGGPIIGDNGRDEPSDPRTAIASIDIPAVYAQDEPVVVIDWAAQHLLIEGYLRSLLFMHSRDPSAELLVWVPQAANNAP